MEPDIQSDEVTGDTVAQPPPAGGSQAGRRFRRLVSLSALLLLFTGCSGCLSTGVSRPAGRPVVKRMLVTGYCNCGICCSWEYPWYSVFGLFAGPVVSSGPNKGRPKKVGYTSSGREAHYGTIAADPSLPYGTVIHVPGYGYGRVEDRGGAITGNHLDVWFSSHHEARDWGRKTLTVEIWKP